MAWMNIARRGMAAGLAAGLLSACATVPQVAAPQEIQILALNDFHGNIVPVDNFEYRTDGGEAKREALGGAARLGATLSALRQGKPHSVTVAAGDLIGASPLVSAFYLDEPTIIALNRVGLEIASVGNHEFDKGAEELKRLQQGGCNGDKLVGFRKPCGLDGSFEGASFRYLAANVVDQAGRTLFPGTTLRKFGRVTVGFVGMTLKETKTLVSPGGTAGYDFLDEADTANAAAAQLRAEGADTVVLLLHQGLDTVPRWNEGHTCPQASGALLPVLERLDPAIRLVVSGHTHNAYVCEIAARDGSPRLITSAGQYGFFVTDIRLTVDPASDTVTGFGATNRAVKESAGEQADVAALVARYAAAVAPEAREVVGKLSGPVDIRALAYIIADAQLAAARAQTPGVDFAVMNRGGVRAPFTPAADGSVTYGQAYALQPFGNSVSVIEITGAQFLAAMEDVFGQSDTLDLRNRAILIPSANASYSYDWSRPAGRRVIGFMVDGQPLDPARTYRVAVNNFLASGGDRFAGFAAARAVGDGGGDLDALQAYLANGAVAPQGERTTDLTPGQ